MSIRATITLDTSEWDELAARMRTTEAFRDAFARAAARQIHARAKEYAPKNTEQMVKNSRVRKQGNASYRVVFARLGQGRDYNFDVALWLHNPEFFPRGDYTPSTPGTGPRFLERAYDDLGPGLHIRFALDLERFLRRARLA